MTRSEYERLPKPSNGIWTAEMEREAVALEKAYDLVEVDEATDGEIRQFTDSLVEEMTRQAKGHMQKLKEWDNLQFVQYTYFACMDEVEGLEAIAEDPATSDEHRITAMLRTQVLAGWLYACKNRIEELGGEIVV